MTDAVVTNEKDWQILTSPSISITERKKKYASFTNIIVYSDHEFLIGITSGTIKTIEIYDTLSDEWITFFELPKKSGFNADITAICLNTAQNQLYLTFTRDYMGILNITNKTIKRVFINADLGNIPSLVLLNEQLHIIGGHKNKKHYTWHTKTQTLSEMHAFTHVQNIVGQRLIYQQSTNRLFMFGGYDNGNHVRLNCIWVYYINTNKWKQSELILPCKMNTFGCIMTMNQKYGIILGGITDISTSTTKNIHIIDLEAMELVLSKIQCPKAALYNAVLMETEDMRNILLINGYVKSICKANNIVIPDDIIKIIHRWYKTGYVHLISLKGIHWKMSVANILKS
eukprot:476060_1